MEAPALADAADLVGLPPLVGEYRRRRPHDTALYQVVLENYRTFVSLREDEGRPLPGFVKREFEKFLACGDLAEGFARVRCGSCGYDRLVAFSCKARGFCPSCIGRRMNDGAAFLADRLIGDTPVRQWVLSLPRPLRYLLAYDSTILGEVVGAFVGAMFRFLRWRAKELLGLRSVSLAHPGAVTVIQRCSGDLSLNIHLHSLVTDGVFVEDEPGHRVAFHALPPPTDGEVADVAWETCRRTREVLIRHGRWKEDADDATGEEAAPDGLSDLYAASLRGILLFGAHQGQRVVRFFGQAASRSQDGPVRSGDAFDLHARQAVHAGDRDAVERLARYVLRPPLASARLERRSDGQVAITLKRPWRDGTAGILFEPLEFVSRLAALVPRARVNTTRFHGVYAAHARLRKVVIPVQEQPVAKACPCRSDDPVRRDLRLSWAQLLARVFQVDVFLCPRCSSRMSRIAWIVDHDVVRKILRAVGLPTEPPVLHPARAAEDLFSEARRARA